MNVEHDTFGKSEVCLCRNRKLVRVNVKTWDEVYV